MGGRGARGSTFTIKNNSTYNLSKTSGTGKTKDYGTMSGSDVKSVLPSGYTYNGLFFSNAGTQTFYEVVEVKE